jgi:hypothetical protein
VICEHLRNMDVVDVWEEPRALIPQILQHLNPVDDLPVVNEIDTTMQNLQVSRAAEREKTTEELQR